MQRAFKQALEQTGVCKQVNIHTLRHSCATHLLAQGTDIRTVLRPNADIIPDRGIDNLYQTAVERSGGIGEFLHEQTHAVSSAGWCCPTVKSGYPIFYAPPGLSPGNAVFDFLFSLCFKSDPESRTRVFHADRTGLVDAMRLLKSGGVLLMMPDVSLQPEDAYLVPFLGRTFDAMMGSASFARRTHSRLVPMLAQQVGNLAFRTQVGNPIAVASCAAPPNSKYHDVAADYLATAKLFATYEQWMAGHVYLWQQIREHFSKNAPFQTLDPARLDKIWPAFLADPRVQPSPTPIPV